MLENPRSRSPKKIVEQGIMNQLESVDGVTTTILSAILGACPEIIFQNYNLQPTNSDILRIQYEGAKEKPIFSYGPGKFRLTYYGFTDLLPVRRPNRAVSFGAVLDAIFPKYCLHGSALKVEAQLEGSPQPNEVSSSKIYSNLLTSNQTSPSKVNPNLLAPGTEVENENYCGGFDLNLQKGGSYKFRYLLVEDLYTSIIKLDPVEPVDMDIVDLAHKSFSTILRISSELFIYSQQ